MTTVFHVCQALLNMTYVGGFTNRLVRIRKSLWESCCATETKVAVADPPEVATLFCARDLGRIGQRHFVVPAEILTNQFEIP